jgi:tetratricopeptide (TPR) repeat protein
VLRLTLGGVDGAANDRADAANLPHGVYAIAGDRREALRILATLQRSPNDDYVDPADVAVIYVGLGDKEAALEWLRRAYDEHSYWLSWLGVDPRWNPLRSEPRFREIEQRVIGAAGQ